MNTWIVRKSFFWLLFFVVCGAFVMRAYVFLDPDFGWHLRSGEIEVNDGVYRGDPFSYTMPSFLFVDHEWVTNMFLFEANHALGYVFLSVFYTILVFAVLYLASSWKDEKYYLPLTILSLAAFLPFFGIRPQVQSWLYLSVVLRLLLDERLWRRWRFVFPFIALLWANTHGSFPLIIVVTFVILASRQFRRRKFVWTDFAVLALSAAATLVNPYGIRLWGEVLMQVTDTSVRWTIDEWMPIIARVDFGVMVYVSFSVAFVIRFWKKYSLEEKLLYLFFLTQGVMSARNFPLYVVVSLPMMIKALDSFYSELGSNKSKLARFKVVYRGFLLLSVIVFFISWFFAMDSAVLLSENRFYPKEAVAYLDENEHEGRIFSNYGWGGYLIWKLPRERVFIDGRMATWKWKAGIAGESDYVMREYTDLLLGNASVDSVFEKYNVGVVLWPNRQPKGFLGDYGLNTRLSSFLGSDEKEEYDFIGVINESGWKLVWEDEVAQIWERP